MATIKTDLICNLNQPVNVTYLHGNLFSQDNAGNTINVFVMDNGEPATIGGTVSANVIRSDGQTVAVSGAIEGNKAYVILPQACYAVPGVVHIIIKLTQNTTVTTIAAIVANVYMSTTDSVIDPGQVIPSIQALMALIEEAVDSIPTDYTGLLHTIAADYSSSKTYKVGDYAWESGVLKRCIVPITAAETYTAAHWTNAVIGDDLTNLKSAFIRNQATAFNAPVYIGDISNASKWVLGVSVAENSGANLTDATACRTGYVELVDNTLIYINSDAYSFIVWEYTANSVASAVYAQRKFYSSDPVIIKADQNATRFRIGVKRVDGSNMTESDIAALTSAVKTYQIPGVRKALKIACFGSSIMWGRDANGSSSAQVENTIPKTIAKCLGCQCDNYGVSGQGYISVAGVPKGYETISSVDLTAYDAMIMMYGENDGFAELGEWNSTDENTIMGQFNKIVNYVYGVNKKIRLIVFAPNNGTNIGQFPDYWYGPRNNPNGYVSRRILSDTLKTACDYYWIPYVEQYDSPINPLNITTALPDGNNMTDEYYKIFGNWMAAKLSNLI